MSDILTIFLFLHTIHIFFYSRKTPYLHISHNICFPYLYIPYLKYPLNKFSLSPHLLKEYHIIYNTLLFLIHLFFCKRFKVLCFPDHKAVFRHQNGPFILCFKSKKIRKIIKFLDLRIFHRNLFLSFFHADAAAKINSTFRRLFHTVSLRLLFQQP